MCKIATKTFKNFLKIAKKKKKKKKKITVPMSPKLCKNIINTLLFKREFMLR